MSLTDYSGPSLLPENIPQSLVDELGPVYRPVLAGNKIKAAYSTFLIQFVCAAIALFIYGDSLSAVSNYSDTGTLLFLMAAGSVLIIVAADLLIKYSINWAMASPRYSTKRMAVIQDCWKQRWSFKRVCNSKLKSSYEDSLDDFQIVDEALLLYPLKAVAFGLLFFISIVWLTVEDFTAPILLRIIPVFLLLIIASFIAQLHKDFVIKEIGSIVFRNTKSTNIYPISEVTSVWLSLFSYKRHGRIIGEVERTFHGKWFYLIYTFIFIVLVGPYFFLNSVEVLNTPDSRIDAIVVICFIVFLLPPFTLFSAAVLLGLPLVHILWRDAESEKDSTRWEDFNKLLSEGSEELRDNFYIGSYRNGPFFINKKALGTHGFIGGATGSGKTSGIAALAAAIIRREESPVVIIDMKGGEYDLFNAMLDVVGGKNLIFFSSNSQESSYCIDPLQDLNLANLAANEVADLILKILELDYGPGYGPSHFSTLIKDTLLDAIESMPEKESYSFTDFYDALPKIPKVKEQAASLYGDLRTVSTLPNLNASLRDSSPELAKAWSESTSLKSVIENNQVLYVHLQEGGTGRMIGTAFLNCFYEVNKSLSGKKPAYIFIDEYLSLIHISEPTRPY